MFILLMFVISMCIAGCAAFFSVKGIGLLFAGSFISVVIMASCLEAGKLIAASFLYRAWHNLSWWIRGYLIIATALLMFITSIGIFGFLSDAYQQTKTRVEVLESTISRLNDESSVLQQQIDTIKTNNNATNTQATQSINNYKKIHDDFVSTQQARVEQLNSRLHVLDLELNKLIDSPNGLFSNKNKQIEQLKLSQQSERDMLNKQLQQTDLLIDTQYKQFISKVDNINSATTSRDVESKLSPLFSKLESNEQSILDSKIQISQTDIGSFKFIARAFDIDTDTAVKWFTLIIVVVFDPLAVCLIVGYNVLLGDRSVTQVITSSKRGMMSPRHRPDN